VRDLHGSGPANEMAPTRPVRSAGPDPASDLPTRRMRSYDGDARRRSASTRRGQCTAVVGRLGRVPRPGRVGSAGRPRPVSGAGLAVVGGVPGPGRVPGRAGLRDVHALPRRARRPAAPAGEHQTLPQRRRHGAETRTPTVAGVVRDGGEVQQANVLLGAGGRCGRPADRHGAARGAEEQVWDGQGWATAGAHQALDRWSWSGAESRTTRCWRPPLRRRPCPRRLSGTASAGPPPGCASTPAG